MNNRSIHHLFKYDTRKELMDKYEVLKSKFFMHNIRFFVEVDNGGNKKYVLSVNTKNKIGDDIDEKF
ncbi:hypothetical protein AST06_11775 [Staphylococcus saprophyticus]|uniref:hypothetical protein n=1 Tax=Staphylococcus saprophyticus TaxID=29385 RepID=UPI0008533877|nr:hypothetical protein [Staphylococcus saprophyticus]OEK72704.1 hypothetical protein AST06_11775 [Staphylococcus saprophyticus]